nr:MAG TPA: hypothetical protein [Caudoviricetes sp.]
MKQEAPTSKRSVSRSSSHIISDMVIDILLEIRMNYYLLVI